MLRLSRSMWVGLAIVLACTLGAAPPARAGDQGDHPKLDKTLNERGKKAGQSRVIVMLKPGWSVDADAKKLGGKLGRSLGLINGKVIEVPNGQLRKLADSPAVDYIVDDRSTAGEMNRVAVTVGARAVQQSYGYRGAGVGVAVIDSGVSGWTNDLGYNGYSSLVRTKNGQRVVGFVDFVNGRTSPYDDNGHGTHVAGIIAGNGANSLGVRAGIAPDAHLVSLKVLDANGHGVISHVIAALDWVVTNKAQYNIRVVNLSVGAAVTMSYKQDPLALAAKRVVDSGVVVVTAAGNLGKNKTTGQPQYGAITAPGNAPWVLTVGASSHQGTVDRSDDVMAPYSSRGPTAIDFQAKPDVVAPGTGVVSLSDPNSLMYTMDAQYLLAGSIFTSYKPYLSLSGTSMAAPVVAGSVALMLQANPSLTPNLVKAIIQYTAQVYPGYDALTEGAGFLNTKGAVDLARYFRYATSGSRYPHPNTWSKTIIWGNYRLHHGALSPQGTAWQLGVDWGSAADVHGANVVWGTHCDDDCDNVVWGTSSNPTCDPAVETCDNVVWGTNVVWATASDDNVVWGTTAPIDTTCNPLVENCDNVVWGTNVVWSTADDDNVVWGTDCSRANCTNVIWGSAADDGDNVVWGTADDGDNVVWGTSTGVVDVTMWSDADDNVTWGTAGEDGIPLYDDPDAPPACYDDRQFDSLIAPLEVVAVFTGPAITDTPATQSAGIGGLA